MKLDAEYMTNPRLIDAGPLAELLYIRALCFAKRAMNDGILAENQWKLVAFGVPSAKKHLKSLVDSGLISDLGDGRLQIAGWLERNKSAEQIRHETERKRQASALANHERWHTGPEGKPSATCSLCHP